MPCSCMLSLFSHTQLFASLWTIACQALLSMEFSRQEYWSGLPCPPPRDILNPGIDPLSLMASALAGGFFTTRATWKARGVVVLLFKLFYCLTPGSTHVRRYPNLCLSPFCPREPFIPCLCIGAPGESTGPGNTDSERRNPPRAL